MSWKICMTEGCKMHIRAGLRRPGAGADGQPLADGRYWKCRARQTTVEDRKAARVARAKLDLRLPEVES